MSNVLTVGMAVPHGNQTHGMSSTLIYGVWWSMVTRCTNPNSESYHNYGGRGIGVCNRWLDFENFLKDMGHRPSSKHTIERIDNDGNYEPGNCKWATRSEQSRNTRRARKLTLNGETHCIAEWGEITGISALEIAKRLHRGWTVERALTRPASTKNRYKDFVGARIIEFNGESLTMSEWAKRIGITKQSLKSRLDRGWSVADALTKGRQV